MRHLVNRLLTHAAARTLARTTFCEEYSEVCTPACRQEALLRRYRDAGDRNRPMGF